MGRVQLDVGQIEWDLDSLVEKTTRSCSGKKSSEFRTGSCSFESLLQNEGGVESLRLFD